MELNVWLRAKKNREKKRGYSKALPSLPEATRAFQSRLHFVMLARIFLSPNMALIQDMNASSSSGTKKDERRERTVSKLAELEVIWSDRKRREQCQYLPRVCAQKITYRDRPTTPQRPRPQRHHILPTKKHPKASTGSETVPNWQTR